MRATVQGRQGHGSNPSSKDVDEKSGHKSRLCNRAKAVRQAQWLGQAVARATPQDQFDGLLQGNAVSDGNVYGLYPLPRADHSPNGFVAILQGNPRAFDVGNRRVGSHKPRFGTSYRWVVEKDAQVRGKPQATGMRAALRVAKEHVGQGGEALEGFEHNREFSKSKKPGHVWERNRLLKRSLSTRSERREVDDNDGGPRPPPFTPTSIPPTVRGGSGRGTSRTSRASRACSANALLLSSVHGCWCARCNRGLTACCERASGPPPSHPPAVPRTRPPGRQGGIRREVGPTPW